MSHSSYSRFCTLCALDSWGHAISLLIALLSWRGDAVIPMQPSGTLPLTILVLSCEASECIPSSVVVPACLSSFSSLLPTHTMLLLPNGCWHGLCAFIRSIPALSVWMQPIGACVSLPGFMACWEPWPSFLGILDAQRESLLFASYLDRRRTGQTKRH
jgi:hypothetical protein